MRQSSMSHSLSIRVYHFYLAFLPSYVRNQVDGKTREPTKIHPTTYLDGFRGVMSFLVFFRHFLLPWFPNIDHGFGQGLGNDSVLQLPILRILYSGPNVPVFLVVSGYVMALKPIRLAREGKLESVWPSLASSVFRRAWRIFPPPLFATFLVMLLVQLDCFDYPYATMPGHIPTHPRRLSNLPRQFVDWLYFVFNDLTNPWTWSTNLPLFYGAHLWTIPLQFRCSMVLFLTIISLARLRALFRTVILLFLAIFSLSHGRWEVALYLGGMGLAEYDLKQRERSTSSLPFTSMKAPKNSAPMRYLFRLASLSLLGLGLYFSSFPRFRGEGAALGYQWAYSLTRNYRYWHAYGATLLVWYLGRSKGGQWLFTTTWTRYLGKLSFSLYIVHEPLLHVLGFRIVDLAWRLTGNDTSFRYGLGIVLAFLATTPILLWLADVFHHLIDEPCGRMAQWAERKCR